MNATYHVICSNKMIDINDERIDSNHIVSDPKHVTTFFCGDSDALYETLYALKVNENLDFDFNSSSLVKLAKYLEKEKVVLMDSHEYKSILIIRHEIEQTILFVSFADDPQHAFAKLNSKNFDILDAYLQKDLMLSYPYIYEYDAQAWFVIANNVQQCKIIAVLKYITEFSKFSEFPEIYLFNIKEDVDNVLNVFSKDIDEITIQEFKDKYLPNLNKELK